MFADLILAGGRIYTLGATGGLRPRTHLAIAGGVVIAVGGPEVMGLRGPRTRRLPLDGAAVLPAFNDAHAHVVYSGLAAFGVKLNGCRSIPELQRRLRKGASRLGPGEWCLGQGYSHLELKERRHPARRELDAAVGDRPAFVDERGGHLRVASSAALAAAALDAGSPDPPGGRLGRLPDGSLDGLLQESAMRLVADRQPPPPLARRKDGILRTQRLLLSRGVTSVGAAVNRGFADDLRAYLQLHQERRLKLRVNQFLSWELLPAADALGFRSGFGGQSVRLGPVKVFVDGGLSTEGAALRNGGGVWRTPPEELREIVRRASAAGLQVAAHAVGDAAIEAMIEAVELSGPGKLRHRIEHCSICPPDLQRRAAAQSMVAVMQPLALSFRDEWSARFGGDLRPHLLPQRNLLRSGVSLAFSSDLPVLPDPDPWPGLAAAVLDEEQGMGRLAALRAYTRGGAYANHSEAIAGTLEVGRLADFQVYEDDPISRPPSRWPGLRPRLVALAGARVYPA